MYKVLADDILKPSGLLPTINLPMTDVKIVEDTEPIPTLFGWLGGLLTQICANVSVSNQPVAEL